MPASKTTHCYAEFAISSPAVAKTSASTHCTYLVRLSEPEWGWKIPEG